MQLEIFACPAPYLHHYTPESIVLGSAKNHGCQLLYKIQYALQ